MIYALILEICKDVQPKLKVRVRRIYSSTSDDSESCVNLEKSLNRTASDKTKSVQQNRKTVFSDDDSDDDSESFDNVESSSNISCVAQHTRNHNNLSNNSNDIKILESKRKRKNVLNDFNENANDSIVAKRLKRRHNDQKHENTNFNQETSSSADQLNISCVARRTRRRTTINPIQEIACSSSSSSSQQGNDSETSSEIAVNTKIKIKRKKMLIASSDDSASSASSYTTNLNNSCVAKRTRRHTTYTMQEANNCSRHSSKFTHKHHNEIDSNSEDSSINSSNAENKQINHQKTPQAKFKPILSESTRLFQTSTPNEMKIHHESIDSNYCTTAFNTSENDSNNLNTSCIAKRTRTHRKSYINSCHLYTLDEVSSKETVKMSNFSTSYKNENQKSTKDNEFNLNKFNEVYPNNITGPSGKFSKPIYITSLGGKSKKGILISKNNF